MTGDPSVSESGSEAEQQVWSVLTDLYLAYLDNDRPRLEAHLAPDCTLFDSSDPVLMTKNQLQAVRRDPEAVASAPRPTALEPSDPRIRVWGEFAVETHQLDARFADSSLDQHLRCSSILRRVDGRWLIEHHHEELLRG